MTFHHLAWACLAAVLAATVPGAQAATITGGHCASTLPGAPDDPPSGQPNIHLHVCNETITIDAITEVAISGPGGGIFTFPDAATAPAPGETGDALAAALAALGLPAGTSFTGLSVTGPVTSQSFTKTEDILLSPSGAYAGDPDDYTTLIPIAGIVQVNVTHTMTVLNAHRLEAQIDTGVNAIPLPATGLLLITGLAGAGALRLRRGGQGSDRREGKA